MKSKEEILDECGVRIFGAQQARILEAMECYAKQKLQQHSVMQAEASGGAEGAAVGNSAAGKGVSGGINCPNCGNEWDITKHNACQCGAQLRGELLR